MNEWFSAVDLAGLPGLTATSRNVTKRAARENWPRRKRDGRGGGWEYHVSCLPTATRLELGFEGFVNSPAVDDVPDQSFDRIRILMIDCPVDQLSAGLQILQEFCR